MAVTVPVVAHLSGVSGTEWRSDLAITNRSDRESRVRVVYQPAPNRLRSHELLLQPFRTKLFEDVVRNLFGEGDGRGPIRIELDGERAVHPAVASRTFSAGARGNFGQGLPAVSGYGTDATYLTGLRHDGKFRSNIAVTASPSGRLTATFVLYRGLDGPVARPVTRRVAAGDQKQWSLERLFPGESDEGVPMTVRVELSAPGVVFGSVVDNLSADAATCLGSVPAREWLVPVIAHVPGRQGSFWRSTVAISNPAPRAATVHLEYRPEIGAREAGPSFAELEIGPGSTIELTDAALDLFGVTDGKGALVVRSSDPTLVSARLFTDAPGGGTSGHGLRAVPLGDLSPGETVLPGVRMTGGFRSNVAVVTGGEAVTFEFRLRDHAGRLAAERTIVLRANGLRQWSVERLFRGAVPEPVQAGSVTVTGSADFLAYLVVVDNSTQDPTFVLP
jgi:hypothetical protein